MRCHLPGGGVITLLLCAPFAFAQDVDHSQHQHATQSLNVDRSSEAEHVSPEPPQQMMGDMPYRSMVSMMQMDDMAPIGYVLFDQFEWRDIGGRDTAAWDARLSYGGDYNKVLIKTEGEFAHETQDARAELLWDRIFSRWWSAQVGMRGDFGEGATRGWLAIGVEGLAPFWFDVDATAYIGDAGRTALRLHVDYDLLITQRLILRSELEADWYGESDPERQIGSGLSDGHVALRLRYELSRKFAPYVGVAWQKKFAGTADFAQAAGLDVSEIQAIAGFRFWF